MIDESSDYIRFRGQCKRLSEAAAAADPTLRLVRGHYYCPIWNRREPHWWCERPDGTIHDPSSAQFPSRGLGFYEPFNGLVECAECNREVLEEVAVINGNYGFCSNICAMRFVGLA